MTKARIVIAIICLFVACAAVAQDEPRFLIERIDVRNAARVSPEIVIAESRLDVNRSYSERELAEASDRLRRLPFLLDAQFSLEKGSVRDAYVLVITVSETKAFFFLIDFTTYYHSNRRGSSFSTESDQGAVVGMRFFVGRKGAVHFGLDNEEAGIDRPYSDNRNHAQVGYTQYDLFGTRAFATLNLRYPLPQIDGEEGRVRPSVLVGIPLTATQTLTAGYRSYAVGGEDESILFGRLPRARAEQIATVRWAYDTTNDPFFPTDGMRFSAGPVMSWGDATGRSFMFGDPTVPPVVTTYAYHRTTRAVELGAAKYWSLSDRNSISLVADGGYSDTNFRAPDFLELVEDQRNTYGTANLGFSHSFWDAAKRSADAGDNRVEVNLRHSRESNEDIGFAYNTSTRANVAWVRRSPWGTVRLGVGYAW